MDPEDTKPEGEISTAAPSSAPVESVDQDAIETPKERPAAKKLQEFRARREARAQERASKALAKNGADPAIVSAAQKWMAYEANEAKRIDAQAASLSEDDRALVASQSSLEAKAKLIARLTSTPAKVVGKAPPVSTPAQNSSLDFALALKDSSAMAEAKTKDPQGFAKFFSSLLHGSGRASTLDAAFKK